MTGLRPQVSDSLPSGTATQNCANVKTDSIIPALNPTFPGGIPVSATALLTNGNMTVYKGRAA